MLDDIKYITNRDKSEALSFAAKQPQQLLHSFAVTLPSHVEIHSVCLAGMGGSAIAARMSADMQDLLVPVVIHNDYGLPAFVSTNSLVVVFSYSGDTAEAISSYQAARDANATIVVVASGGQLVEMAEADNVQLALVPTGVSPRLAVLYMYRALAEIFEAVGLESGLVTRLTSIAQDLSEAVANWSADTPASTNIAKQLSMEIAGKSVVIYAAEHLKSAAYKWKISCNENAKNIAFYNFLPEMNHNELLGWTSHPQQKPYAIIELLSSDYSAASKQRFEVMNTLLSGRMPAAQTIQAQGGDNMYQLIWTMLLGDFVGIYLGIINNVDPTQIKALDTFKKSLEV